LILGRTPRTAGILFLAGICSRRLVRQCPPALANGWPSAHYNSRRTLHRSLRHANGAADSEAVRRIEGRCRPGGKYSIY
jgi:hypothetical protein